MTIERTIEIPANRRINLEVPREIPEGRVVLTFTPASSNPLSARKAKSKAARQKLRELCKDSPLTVESFLAMKEADRVLEAAIDKHSGSNVQ
ncbi:hypothetical protein FACS189476_03010 [Spirochaetia bacterium]|nr:hypothetical protein FACS189476_03010 [Spirochaetia bacterium]